MKELRGMVIGLIACVTVLAFAPGTAGGDKIPNQVRATIMAVAEDGTTWVAGEAKFVVANDKTKITVDVATAVPNASFGFRADTDPPVIHGIEIIRKKTVTNKLGDVKASWSFVISPLAQGPFAVWVTCFVTGSTTEFVSEPVIISPN